MTLKSRLAKFVVGTMVACGSFVGTGLVSATPYSTTAHASTVKTVHSVERVWLRSSHRIAKNGIRREPVGENFQVLGVTRNWWHVRDGVGKTGYIVRKAHWVQTGKAAVWSYANALPPGVIMSGLTPKAARTANISEKRNAVLSVARSKLGTPYRWGHNEDRGQYGFDCSNYTAYVYHHALGYKMSGASKIQAKKVGWRVAKGNMKPGDLLIFENGKHVGIYVGQGKMIQEGGGLGKVGYLSLKPGSYWGKHLTSVRRMFH